MKGMYTRVVMMLLSFALLASPAQAAFTVKAATEVSATSEAAMKSAAVASWKSMSRAERKSFKKSLKESLRSDDPSTNQLLLIILAILLPPLAVFLHEGKANNRFLLSILLWLLLYVPGLIYALYIILS